MAKGFIPKIVSKKENSTKLNKSSSNPQKNKKKSDETKKKKKARTTYLQYDMRDADQFSLCDAMRYVEATFFSR